MLIPFMDWFTETTHKQDTHSLTPAVTYSWNNQLRLPDMFSETQFNNHSHQKRSSAFNAAPISSPISGDILNFCSNPVMCNRETTAGVPIHQSAVRKTCFVWVIIKSTPGAAGTANLSYTAGLHTHCANKIKTFFTPVDTAASCRADLVSHCAFSVCDCASPSFKHTLWTMYVWWMWEKMCTTCKQPINGPSERLYVHVSVFGRWVLNIKLAVPLQHTGSGFQLVGSPVSCWSQRTVPSSVSSRSSCPPAEDSETPTGLPASLSVRYKVHLLVILQDKAAQQNAGCSPNCYIGKNKQLLMVECGGWIQESYCLRKQAAL